MLQHQYAGETAPHPPVNPLHLLLPTMTQFHNKHHAYKFQVAITIVSLGGGSERCQATTSYPNLGNDCCVSSTLVPDRHVDLLLSNALDDVYSPTQARSCWMLMLSNVAMCKGPNFPRTRGVDSPISRNNCWQRL